jgi:transposase
LTVTLTGGNHDDITQLIPLIDAVPPIRGRRGRPRRKPREIYADRGYDHDNYRHQTARTRDHPADRPPRHRHGSDLGRTRWVVERGFAWLHAFKRLRTRYERRADIHLGLRQLACALIWYRQLSVVLK